MCLANGAARNRAPRWRTTRALTITRRDGERNSGRAQRCGLGRSGRRRPAGARRSRAHPERPSSRLASTWPMKLFGTRRRRRTRSRPDAKIIVATGHRGPALVKIPADGAAIVDFRRLFVLSGSRAWAGADRKIQSNQPHAPRPTAVLLSRRPLVVFPCTPLSDTQTCAKARQTAMKPDPAHGLRFPTGRRDEQAAGLRSERGPIFCRSVGRRRAAMRIG